MYPSLNGRLGGCLAQTERWRSLNPSHNEATVAEARVAADEHLSHVDLAQLTFSDDKFNTKAKVEKFLAEIRQKVSETCVANRGGVGRGKQSFVGVGTVIHQHVSYPTSRQFLFLDNWDCALRLLISRPHADRTVFLQVDDRAITWYRSYRIYADLLAALSTAAAESVHIPRSELQVTAEGHHILAGSLPGSHLWHPHQNSQTPLSWFGVSLEFSEPHRTFSE